MKEKDERIEKIMEALSYCDFEDLDDNEDDFYTKIIEPFKSHYNEEVYLDWASGASKGVLIFEKFNFVIKIPFRYDSHWDEEEFRGANNMNNNWDYCETEAELYSSAEDEGVEDCFAKMKYIGSVNDYPIYKQDMALVYTSADETTSSYHTKEDEEMVDNICETEGYNQFNTNWLSDAFVYFGEEKFYKLMNFINNYSIDDLHSNNIGYIGMKPVILDYSGWNE